MDFDSPSPPKDTQHISRNFNGDVDVDSHSMTFDSCSPKIKRSRCTGTPSASKGNSRQLFAENLFPSTATATATAVTMAALLSSSSTTTHQLVMETCTPSSKDDHREVVFAGLFSSSSSLSLLPSWSSLSTELSPTTTSATTALSLLCPTSKSTTTTNIANTTQSLSPTSTSTSTST